MSITITSLSSIEIRVGIVISNSIGVGVGRGFIRVSWSMVGGGSMDYWGMVGRSSMNNRSMVDNRSMIGRCCMDNWSSMINWSMGNNSLSSMKTVWRVSYSSDSSSKCFRLSGASVFSLVWFRHGLVGNLASRTGMISCMGDQPKRMWVGMWYASVVGNSRSSYDQAKEGLHVVSMDC